MTRLTLKNVHVEYPVVTSSGQISILGAVAERMSFGRLRRARPNLTYVHAVRGVSVELSEGMRLGVVGRNGSGKSTLLQVIAGILAPTRGLRTCDDRVSAVLNIAAGLNMEATGRENVRLICKVFGFSPTRRAAVEDDIEGFVELGGFFDMPVRTYSAGMMVRLSFAIATSLPGAVLVVDEVLGAGDAHFQARSAARIRARAEKAGVLVMATHSRPALEEFCTHAIWMHAGQVRAKGSPREVWQAYADFDFAAEAA